MEKALRWQRPFDVEGKGPSMAKAFRWQRQRQKVSSKAKVVQNRNKQNPLFLESFEPLVRAGPWVGVCCSG